MQYRRRDSLVSIYELSKRFIDQLIREMEQDGRYPEDAIIRGKGYILVDEDAFRDFLRHRGQKLPYVRPVETPEKVYLRGVETR